MKRHCAAFLISLAAAHAAAGEPEAFARATIIVPQKAMMFAPGASLLVPMLAQIRTYPVGFNQGGDFTLTGAWDFSGATTDLHKDSIWKICDNGDPTKCARLETSIISTATTRIYSFPGTGSVFALQDAGNQWSVGMHFGVGINHTYGANTSLIGGGSEGTTGITLSRAALTPDAASLYTGTASESWHLAQIGDATFDLGNGPCGTEVCTNPTFITHSAAQNTTNFSASAYYGTAGKWVTTLTESSATAVYSVAVADNASVSGTIRFKVFASDGTDHQARYGELMYVAVNEADTETCTLSGSTQADDGNIAAITSGTLTYAWVCAGGTNAISITLNAVSSLTQTTLSLEAQVDHVGAGEPLPQ